MNKVFKVIWNHATQTWTAVSELGHAKGKTKSKKIVKLTALAGAVLSVVGTAQAAVEVSSSSITIKSDDPAADHATKGIDNVNIGTGANTFRDDGNNVVSHDAIAIGTNATGTGDKAVAIGKNASATKENGIAIGFDATNQSIDSVAIGREATSSKDMDVAIGKKAAASGGESLAFGSESKASGQATVAVGKNSNASGSSAVAAGYDTTAAGDNAVAVGNKATASQVNDIAVGLRASATGGRSIATGTAANASGAYSIATGFTAAASGTESIAVGSKSSATKQDSTAIGVAATSTGNFALAMGSGANSAGHGSISTGFNSKATESGAIATGTQANASKVGSVAIGSNAQAKHDNSVALGTGSVTDDKHPFANLKIAGQNYDFAGTKLDGVVSIGTKDKERQIQNVGAGRISKTSTDAINGSQLYAVADAVSNHHWVVGGNTTAQNTGAPQVSNHSNVTNKDIVEFQNGNGTKATIEYTEASQSSGTPAKTVVKYHANIVNGDNTEVVTNADGSIKINAKAGKDTTAAVTTKTPDALKVTSKTENNVTTYNVDAQTGSISTTDAGSATFKENGDAATGGNFGSRLTNVSTVTDIVNNVSWHLNSSAVPGSGGKITDGSDTKAADVKASNTVNINAGKNIEIKRNGTTIEISSTAAGEKGEKGDKGEDGKNAQAKVEKQPDGSHLITIVDGDGNTTTTIVKDGATGAAGAKGEKGDTGEKGGSITGEVVDNEDGTHTITITDLETGSVTTTIVKDGKNGKDGKDGATGAKGDTGATGAKGEKGDTGAAGAKGDTGAKGEKGDKGDKGDTGEKGGSITGEVVDNGDGTHTITITDLETGSVTTTIVKDGKDGVDGKNAKADVKDNGNGTHTVTITDGEGNTTTTIIKDGATGAKGDKGDTGATGEKGEKGDTGAKGDKGDTGAKGDKGDTGAKGDKGDTGAKGDKGDTGAKGDKGDTGEKGDKGDTGAKGDKGDTGEKGGSITGEVVDNGDGTHTITITDLETGSVTTTIVKDGKDGVDGKNAKADVKDNGNGTHTVTITDGEGNTTTTIVKDGKNAEAEVKDNKDGTHTVTIKDGNGNTTTTIVKDGAKGEKGDKGDKGEDGVMTWDIKSTGNTTPDSQTDAKTIEHKNTVEMVAGKNLTVNQTNNSDGAKVEFALNSTVTNLDKVVVNGPKGKDGEDGKDGVTITAPVKAEDGKPGKDGSDGKVGISGKDGKDAVSISGKDGVGQIGLTGPKGKDGKDGASINITTDNGKQTLVNLEKGAKGEKGETTQRIVYKPVDKDGNPIKNNDGNDIVREVATMDDGLIFGGNTEDTHKAALGTQVNVKGATTNTDWNKFDAGKNIMTKVEGNTITVGLAKDLEVNSVNVTTNVTAGNVTANGTISAPTIKAGDTTIQNGKVTNLKHHIENPTTVVDDKVLNVSEDVKKEAATVRDVLNSGWNLQANGKPVDAVTHGNTVNFANGKGITVTAEPNKDGTTSKVSFDVNVDNDTITVNDKGQLVSNGSTNFNVATKDGGNKVAKKGGSSTTKITSGKTITYTAGKNIAIEQNGGDILVSTTDDVNHNSVTTKDLTVNKGGNIDMGGNQVHNVKAGTKDTDAVNVSQLKQSIGDVHKRINKVGKEARGGIAGANAAAGLPQVYIPGKSMVAASAGTFKGESAVAVGYSRSSDNGKVIFKLQGNANTQGDVGGSVGVGYQW